MYNWEKANHFYSYLSLLGLFYFVFKILPPFMLFSANAPFYSFILLFKRFLQPNACRALQ